VLRRHTGRGEFDGELRPSIGHDANPAIESRQRRLGVQRSDAELTCGPPAGHFANSEIGTTPTGADVNASAGLVDLDLKAEFFLVQNVQKLFDRLRLADVGSDGLPAGADKQS